jgi:hypothetical protein
MPSSPKPGWSAALTEGPEYYRDRCDGRRYLVSRLQFAGLRVDLEVAQRHEINHLDWQPALSPGIEIKGLFQTLANRPSTLPNPLQSPFSLLTLTVVQFKLDWSNLMRIEITDVTDA